MKYIRATTNGLILEWNARLAARPEWEEVTEQEAFPERFAPVDLAKHETKVDISVPVEVTVAPVVVSPELEAEATRSMERKTMPSLRRSAPKASQTAGLKGAF